VIADIDDDQGMQRQRERGGLVSGGHRRLVVLFRPPSRWLPWIMLTTP
jgi:hypothetical protein